MNACCVGYYATYPSLNLELHNKNIKEYHARVLTVLVSEYNDKGMVCTRRGKAMKKGTSFTFRKFEKKDSGYAKKLYDLDNEWGTQLLKIKGVSE